MKLYHCSSFVICLSLAVVSNHVYGNVLAIDDVVAGCKYNASLLASPHLAWSCIDREGQGRLKSLEKQKRDLKRRAEKATEETAKRVILAELEACDKAIATFRRNAAGSRRDYELWSDGENLHLRMPADPSSSVDGLGTWRSPAASPTPSALLSDFGNVILISLVPDRNPPTRRWNGVDKSGHGDGLVSTKTLEQTMPFLFPLYCTPSRTLSSPYYDVVDWMSWLLDQRERKLRVLREERLEGRSCVVIQDEKLEIAHFADPYEKSIHIGTYTTFWLDIDRGFVPLKIHRTVSWMLNGKRVGKSASDEPFIEVGFRDIRKVVTGGFYPFEMVERRFMDDPDHEVVDITPEDLKQGRLPPRPPRVLVGERTLLVGVFEPRRPPSEVMLALAFPKNTVYFDGTANRAMIEGLSQEEVDRRLEWKPSEPRPKSDASPSEAPERNVSLSELHRPPASVLSRYAIANIVLALLFLAFLIRRVYRNRSK